MEKGERDLLEVVGTILLIAGVGVWGIYAMLHFGIGLNVTVREFLPYHLAGVVPGIILRRHRFFLDMFRRLLS